MLKSGRVFEGPLSTVYKHQDGHTDFDWTLNTALFDKECPDVPLSVLIAIMPGTKVWICPGSRRGKFTKWLQVDLKVGEALVFRGDCLHAGFDHDVDNTRVHRVCEWLGNGFGGAEGRTGIHDNRYGGTRQSLGSLHSQCLHSYH